MKGQNLLLKYNVIICRIGYIEAHNGHFVEHIRGGHMAKKLLALVVMLMLIAIPINANAQTYPTKGEVCSTVKKNLLAHRSGFTINMSVKTMQELRSGEDLMYTVFRLDDKTTSKDFDYLKLNIDSWKESWTWSTVSGSASLTVSV